jgi:DNA-binding CsgD family transcriptional regulator
MIVEGISRPAKPRRPRSCPSSPREREVLQLIAEGNSYKEIAAALKISPKTVGQHRGRLMQKLHCRRTAELVKFALREGVTPDSE